MSYSKDDYKAEIAAWEKKHGDVKYLHPATFPKWVRKDEKKD